ncbi:RNA polymerase sigma factor, sigma-70 family [Singulisphaera sp. GP187]|uniref:sigma-70 family RNA polymerase sigma factor n=1 Tax=Singulisphaera sp. GP187 TaxID=1882752 RepID=UPI0009267E88|nr:sigma-70 family RNA polymerase sigma factor [Singulisphaera sp. GP187]SIO61435.1 RNA polymerase sigma factor, sigma-70 family [Singulisphaera sp. GP187]
MQDHQCDYLMQLLNEDPARSSMEGEPTHDGKGPKTYRGQDSSEWVTIHCCLKRIRRWRVPPHWSCQDWFDEIMAEVTLSVVQATNDFDVSRNVPFGAFLHRRILHTALARYRREWTYAIHQSTEAAVDNCEAVKGAKSPSREAVGTLLNEAIARLPSSDASLIEEIFWEGKTEACVAEVLGISQQAVNKRKHNIFRLLDNIIRTRFPQIAPGADSEAPLS